MLNPSHLSQNVLTSLPATRKRSYTPPCLPGNSLYLMIGVNVTCDGYLTLSDHKLTYLRITNLGVGLGAKGQLGADLQLVCEHCGYLEAPARKNAKSPGLRSRYEMLGTFLHSYLQNDRMGCSCLCFFNVYRHLGIWLASLTVPNTAHKQLLSFCERPCSHSRPYTAVSPPFISMGCWYSRGAHCLGEFNPQFLHADTGFGVEI
jgi:hypothetical protein